MAQEQLLKIEDLVATASLDVSVLAGGGGLGREVLWAHSCEMISPERWLGPHELLMTVGLCVPTEAQDQAGFVRQLDTAGLAGLMIGDHDTAPPISQAMLEEADQLAFPILLAAEATPYAVVARHVAAASSSSQILQVLKLSKLYQIAATADEDADALTQGLATLLSIGIRVIDGVAGVTILETKDVSSNGTERQRRTFPLHGSHPAELQLDEFPTEILDSFILVHLMKVLEVIVDRLLNRAEHRMRTSSQALASLLQGDDPADGIELLERHRPADGFRIVALQAEDGQALARDIAIRQIPVLMGPGRTDHDALVPNSLLPVFREIVENRQVHVGVSSLFTEFRDVSSAAEEAGRVLAVSRYSGRLWTEFEGTTISVLARSYREADEIIAGVLGTLAGRDTAKVKLRETLFAYLRNDRHWQKTADELGVHRQTLSYRLNRIESETGLSVTRSADLSALWVAYQAWEATRPEISM